MHANTLLRAAAALLFPQSLINDLQSVPEATRSDPAGLDLRPPAGAVDQVWERLDC